MDDMASFRQQMHKNSLAHGGTETPAATAAPKLAEKDEARVKKILAEAEALGLAAKDDEVIRVLFELFLPEAKTTEGKDRALKMSIAIAKRLRARFEIAAKPQV